MAQNKNNVGEVELRHKLSQQVTAFPQGGKPWVLIAFNEQPVLRGPRYGIMLQPTRKPRYELIYYTVLLIQHCISSLS
jgi:hypothetical protein